MSITVAKGKGTVSPGRLPLVAVMMDCIIHDDGWEWPDLKS